jgi:hypothetical protein
MLRDFILEFMLPLVAFCVFVVALIIGVMLAYASTFGRWGCQDFASISGLDTRWTLSLGCYVKAPNGQWMTERTYNGRNVQNRHEIEHKVEVK